MRSTVQSAVALGFPGQGGDWGAAVDVLAAHGAHPLVGALARRLGVPSDTWAGLDQWDTRVSQPVVYVAGLLAAEAGGVTASSLVAVTGHSLGEITAAVHAGAMDPLAGLDVVVRRAELGHRAQANRPGAMVVAFTPIDDRFVDLVDRIRSGGGVLAVAVTNGVGQHVLSGDEELVESFTGACDRAGITARRLPIGGPYHSELLADAVPGFRTQLEAAVLADPRCPIVASTSPGVLRRREEVVDVLASSLIRPVDWPRTLAILRDLGVERLLDAGPGRTLVRLQKACALLPVDALGQQSDRAGP